MSGRARIRGLAAAVLSLLAGGNGVASAQASPPRAPVWIGDQRILYLHGGPPRDAKLFDTVRTLGFTAVSAGTAAEAAGARAAGLQFYADQIVGKGILELRDPQWTRLRDSYEATRDPTVLQRPSCLATEDSAAALAKELEARLGAMIEAGPMAACLGDEVSTTRQNNPLDLCRHPECLAAFVAFLRSRHGDLTRLNTAWGTDYQAWDEVRPWTADEIRAREFDDASLPRNLRPWAEHLEFKDRQFAGVIERLSTLVAARRPELLRGLTGIQPPTAYGGHDLPRLMPTQTFFEVYDIGGARDLAQCYVPAAARQVATLFPQDEEQPPDFLRARLFDGLAHGLAGSITWSAGDVIDAEGRPTDYGRALAAAFRTLEPARVVAGAELLRDPVWLVDSQASVRAHWMLDSIADGDTWIRRWSSYEHTHSTSLAARHSWIRLLEDYGVQPRLVAAEDLPAMLGRSPPLLLVLPATLALSDAQASAVAGYVHRGGTALADHGLAIYDEHLKLREQGALDDVFGVTGRTNELQAVLVREGQPVGRARLEEGAGAAEAGLSGSIAEPVGEFRVQIEHGHGDGQTVYLNLAVCEYGTVRLDPARHDTALDLRARVRKVLQGAAVEAPVEVVGAGLPTCVERLRLRASNGERYLAIRVNALESPALMADLSRRGPFAVELLFPNEVGLRDVFSGKHLGRGARFEATLDPWRGLLYQLDAE
ncbi:MAG: alpha-amylase family protein [Planctomycetota bacterium]